MQVPSTDADEWSADNAPGGALLSLTAHWIDKKFNRRYAMLHAHNLETAHTGDYLAQVTTDMLAGWHLHKDRVQYVLHDNATVMVKAMRVENLLNIGCMAHTTTCCERCAGITEMSRQCHCAWPTHCQTL